MITSWISIWASPVIPLSTPFRRPWVSSVMWPAPTPSLLRCFTPPYLWIFSFRWLTLPLPLQGLSRGRLLLCSSWRLRTMPTWWVLDWHPLLLTLFLSVLDDGISLVLFLKRDSCSLQKKLVSMLSTGFNFKLTKITLPYSVQRK